jgi:putative peptide zinc metalloprotease protein
MPEPLFSASWYRVAELRPRLRGHARIHRHVYRGRPWYVLQDVSSQRFHRFTPATQKVIGLMDGERSVQEIWEIATERLGDDAPTQDETIRLRAQLHGADVLQCDVPPDTAELLERSEKRGRRELIGRVMNPFAIRIPMFDPERFLRRFLPMVRPLMGWVGAAVWLAVVVPALVLTGVHWTELTEGILDRILTPQNLVVIWLIFPVIKTLHELGHGFAAKAYGGEVHDIGIMLLVFTPIPYVEASSASAFPEKSKRALVGAAGMVVEVFVAALALFVWVAAEPGVVRTVAYNTMLIGGVTTLGFNANPLLRFDGYYILSDLIEIPNLRQKSNGYLGYMLQRYGFGWRDAELPDAAPGERAWLVGYAISAFVYRVFVIVAIFLLVLDRSLVLGCVLIGMAGIGWFGIPLVKGLRFLLVDPRIRRVRPRAIAVVTAGLALLVLLTMVPVPFRTLTEGVVWIPDQALVRMRGNGFVERVVATPGSRVQSGELLFQCRDPEIEAEVAIVEAQLRGLDARYNQRLLTDRAGAEMIEDRRFHLRKQFARARQRLGDLTIRAATDGVFVAPRSVDLPGRLAQQGTLLAHVINLDSLTVRAVVPQEDIGLLGERLEGVEVRLSERLSEVIPARLKRVVPAASAELPSRALGQEGGGQLPVDLRDQSGASAVAKFFVVELEVPVATKVVNAGGRVHVRFDHGLEPLASQWYRRVRQLFLSRFDV